MVPEARMERSAAGLVAATEGWFAVNIRDAAWVTSETFADACVFEGRSELALRHGAGVESETSSSREAYAPFGRWRLGPPASFDGLPWALR